MVEYNIIRLTCTFSQLVCWSFSALMLRFEYMRALGHIWYMHPLFIWLSFVIYAIDMLYSILLPESSEDAPHPKLLYVCIVCIVASSFFLAGLVTLYKQDVPFERRQYMHNQYAALGERDLISRTGSIMSKSPKSRSSSKYSPQELAELEKKKRLPILTAKVTSQISID